MFLELIVVAPAEAVFHTVGRRRSPQRVLHGGQSNGNVSATNVLLNNFVKGNFQALGTRQIFLVLMRLFVISWIFR